MTRYLAALCYIALYCTALCACDNTKIPTTAQIKKAAEEFEPIKDAKENYTKNIEARTDDIDAKKLRGDSPTSTTKSRSGKWHGPAAQDPNSGWKTSTQSGWRGPTRR